LGYRPQPKLLVNDDLEGWVERLIFFFNSIDYSETQQIKKSFMDMTRMNASSLLLGFWLTPSTRHKLNEEPLKTSRTL